MTMTQSINVPLSGKYQIALIRRFDFSSKFQRMSVIVRDFLTNSFKAFVKGSPERIMELCVKESIPSNYEEILQIYTENGYRVLAIAYKSFDSSMTYIQSQRIERDSVECELIFLGFLIMQNRLKPVTTGVIE